MKTSCSSSSFLSLLFLFFFVLGNLFSNHLLAIDVPNGYPVEIDAEKTGSDANTHHFSESDRNMAPFWSGDSVNDFMTVTDVGNEPYHFQPQESDVTQNGFVGEVSYRYRITRQHMRVWQFISFLNHVARWGDPYGLYQDWMGKEGVNHHALIIRGDSSGSYLYKAAPGAADLPMIGLSRITAERVLNWLNNGQPAMPPETFWATETGSYDLSFPAGDIRRYIPMTTANYRLATLDELYKAIFYKGLANGGYYTKPWSPNIKGLRPYKAYQQGDNKFLNHTDAWVEQEKPCFFGAYGDHVLGAPGVFEYVDWSPKTLSTPFGSGFCLTKLHNKSTATFLSPSGVAKPPQEWENLVNDGAWNPAIYYISPNYDNAKKHNWRIDEPLNMTGLPQSVSQVEQEGYEERGMLTIVEGSETVYPHIHQNIWDPNFSGDTASLLQLLKNDNSQ